VFPTPGQQAFDDTQRNVDAYGETDRYWRINRLEALYNGQQYEGRPSFWNKTVPVVERAPHVQSRYARAVVDRVAHFVFGRRRFPRFAAQSAAYGVTLSDEERAALGAVVTELVAATKLTSVALAYLTEGLKTGSAVVVCGMRDGLPRAQILPSKWCTPEFDARGNVRRMVVEYKALLGGELHWHRREITATSDRTWPPVKVDPKHAPQWSLIAPVVDIALTFCPVVWTKNLPPATASEADADGVSLLDGLGEEVAALDRNLSQFDRYGLYNGDPQIIRKGAGDAGSGGGDTIGRSVSPDAAQRGLVADFMQKWRGSPTPGAATKKAPGTIWDLPADGGADLMESSGAAVNIFGGVMKELRRALGDATGVLLADPDVMGKGDLSARALTLLHAPMLDLADVLSADYGPALVTMVSHWLRLIATNPGAVHIASAQDPAAQAALARFWTRDAKGALAWLTPPLTLAWGPYFEPSGEEIAQRIDAAQKAAGGAAVASRRTAVALVAQVTGVEDVDAECEAIDAEQGAERAAVTQTMRALSGEPEHVVDDAPEVTITEPVEDAPVAAPIAPPADAPEKAADSALNSAQSASMMAIVEAVAQYRIPRGAGREMLKVSFLIDDARADRMLDSAGTPAFVPGVGLPPLPSAAPAPPPAAPAQPPPGA
jgi:hypothetical protein